MVLKYHCDPNHRNLSSRTGSLALEQDNIAALAPMAQATGQQVWGSWAEQQPPQAVDAFWAMNIPGLPQTYDTRSNSSSDSVRTVMPHHYGHNHTSQPYPGTSSNNLLTSQHHVQQHHHVQQNPFSFNPYPIAASNGLISPPLTYNQHRPLPRLMQPEAIPDGGRIVSYTRNDHLGAVAEPYHSRSPPIKQETYRNAPIRSPVVASANTKSDTSVAPDASFNTPVDIMVKAIQAKSQLTQSQQSSPVTQHGTVAGQRFTPPYIQMQGENTATLIDTDKDAYDKSSRGSSPDGNGNKKFRCNWEGSCRMGFGQKTHLEIHLRKHTGDKPYPCKFSNCGRWFSQLGNLRSHVRRHTGERPYSCDICGKRFPQRANLGTHKLVHEQTKPFICKLDDCGKPFTQRGNLKNHQNKFHIATIQKLTAKFASVADTDTDIGSSVDREMWKYFADLYKNSNKGIKGRGKNNKVGNNSISLSSSINSLSINGSGFSMSGAGRGNLMTGSMTAGSRGAQAVQGHRPYEMFDTDDSSQNGSQSGAESFTSQAGSRSGTGSSVGTCCDDVPTDGYEDHGRVGHLAFGDRIFSFGIDQAKR